MAASLASFLYPIILLGALQGFITGGLLIFSKKRAYANRLLGVVILLIALASFNLYGSYKGWFGSAWLSFFATLIPFVMVMPIGPLIYFYVQAYTNPSFTISKKQRVHFLPSVIDLGPSLTVIVFLAGLLLHLFKNNSPAWGNFISAYNVYADIPRWASLTIYVWLSVKHLYKIKEGKPGSPTLHAADYKWLKQFLYAMMILQCVWLVFLIPYIMPKYSNKLLDTFDWFPLYIPMAVLVYWLGIKGYLASQQVIEEKKDVSPQTAIPEHIIRQTKSMLEKVMQHDKLYLNPNLTVDTLSQHINLPPKTISAVLNQYMYTSFNEFINRYRVEAFKVKVMQPETENLTIAGIAADCGFNSLATFQRTFKQVTGMSPSAFRKGELAVS